MTGNVLRKRSCLRRYILNPEELAEIMLTIGINVLFVDVTDRDSFDIDARGLEYHKLDRGVGIVLLFHGAGRLHFSEVPSCTSGSQDINPDPNSVFGEPPSNVGRALPRSISVRVSSTALGCSENCSDI